MENTVRLTIRSNNLSKNRICENTSANIDFIITISPEKMLNLKNAIESISNCSETVFPEGLMSLITETKKGFINVEPLSELEAAVTNIMNELGIPAHTKGYRYLRDAVVLSTENPDLIGKVTKVLYPTIADTYNTTPIRVERVMRHAIEYCCMKGNHEVVNTLFAHCLASQRGKPTNSEFIAILSDKLRMHS